MRKPTRTIAAIAAALILTSAAPLPAAASAAPEVTVSVSMAGQMLCAGEAQLIEDTTYMPLRAFCAELGVTDVRWAADEGAAYVDAPGLSMRVGIGEQWITVNDRAFWVPAGVQLINGVTMVPVRPLARAFGLDVAWDGATRSVTLTDTGAGYATPASEIYDENDLYWLARIISAESRNEPLLGQLAVGNVVLNRAADPTFPDSIYDVIFDTRYAIQFSPVGNGTVYEEPADSSILAAKLALEGYTVSTEIIYFLNPDLASNFWVPQNRPFAMTVGSHDFYT